MSIYKIHTQRLVALIILGVVAFVLIAFTPPQQCVQVSISVRKPSYPYEATVKKHKRIVHALLQLDKVSTSDNAVPSGDVKVRSDARFRTHLVHRSENEDLEDDREGQYEDEDYYDDEDVFEEGDFDYNDTASVDEGLKFGEFIRGFFRNSSSELYSSQDDDRVVTVVNAEGMPVVEDRIFWSGSVEQEAPKGADDAKVELAQQKMRKLRVRKVEPPTWNRCGRPKNQFVVFEDGSKACARYRAPHQFLVQGEILSFYLSRLLGIHNVPTAVLAKTDYSNKWKRDEVWRELQKSDWQDNTTVALIEWIENLERDKMPALLLSSLMSKKPLSADEQALRLLPTPNLVELLQWSDLIIFDYITGNYDRVASMQDAAEKESKPSILGETIHNLVRSKSDGALWLIDNESGLLDSYSLLYGTEDGRFRAFHGQMLAATCLFRRPTVQRLRELNRGGRAGSALLDLVRRFEPLFEPIKDAQEVSKRLQERIREVNDHIERCSR